MVEAAQHLDDHPGPLGAFFRRIAAKKGRNKAVVATARKLVVIAWHMLMHNEPYRYAKPATTKSKLVQLRTSGGGGRRRGGVPERVNDFETEGGLISGADPPAAESRRDHGNR